MSAGTGPMTPEQFDTVRLRIQCLAKDLALEWSANVLAIQMRLLPPEAQVGVRLALAQKLSQLQATMDKLTLSDQLTPAESDMYSAELSEATRSELAQLYAALGIDPGS